MFAHPRVKKSGAFQPPPKKRKTVHTVEEVSFDNKARAEYLTGFHKRKLERKKKAQEIAAEKERKEKIEFRKQLREERRQQVEDHVNSVKAILKESQIAGLGEGSESEEGSDQEWDGFEDIPVLEPIDHEEEYIDEDRYTTVTVEAVSVDRDGLHKPERDSAYADEAEDEQGEGHEAKPSDTEGDVATSRREREPKKKKKKFRYESKVDRQLSERKIKARKARLRQ